MILVVGIYIILLGIFCVVPIPAKIIMLLLNLFITDPIPVFDELFMIVSILKKINTVINVADFVKRHRKKIIVGGIVALLIFVHIALHFIG